jgi:hypothetical protein
MEACRPYFALSFSGIQKTVLRHGRLWSIAGASQILSNLNEAVLPRIVSDCGGKVIVAGGGKLTARFESHDDAERARAAAVKAVATTLPMLEFQVSPIVSSPSFGAALKDGLTAELARQKGRYRGYGVSFSPHLRLCEECSEYPAVDRLHGATWVCPSCRLSYRASKDLDLIGIRGAEEKDLTSIQRVYRYFIAGVETPDLFALEIPADFEEIFGSLGAWSAPRHSAAGPSGIERQRMAVWFSDLNNMKSKVQAWLLQPEDEVEAIFEEVKAKNVAWVGNALRRTFRPRSVLRESEPGKKGPPKPAHLPFRLVVAGGDDLCLVMPEKFILDFVLKLDAEFHEIKKDETHPSSAHWLQRRAGPQEALPRQPFSFGGSFVVTPPGTPFHAIHETGEALLSEAKEASDRAANSVNWRLLGMDLGAEPEQALEFDKPLFINEPPDGPVPPAMAGSLSLKEYIGLMGFYAKKLSRSQRRQVIDALLSEPDAGGLEKRLLRASAAGLEKGIKYLLVDENFREGGLAGGRLSLRRMATMLELLSLADGEGSDD